MNTKAKLIRAIDDYLRRSGMSARTFGKAAINDTNVVYHLRSGHRDLTLNTVERLERYMLENPVSSKKKLTAEARAV